MILSILSIALNGCSFSKKDNPIKVSEEFVVEVEHAYSEIEDLLVKWDEVFNIDSNCYFVYYFSVSCSHCLEIKNYVIEEALKRDDIFFVKASSTDRLKNDVFSTIGVGIPEEIAILGYPSCIKIENKKVTKNVAGKSAILQLLS